MNTHLSQFYGTNHVPSDAELLEIEQLLVPSSTRLSQLEKDLEDSEAKVLRLKKEKEDILRVVKPLKSLASLIRRFPREVMELIFMHCIPATVIGRPSFNVCQAPLILLRVCRLWREIALTTPGLWTSIDLTIPTHLCRTFGQPPSTKIQERVSLFLEEVDRWLKRSENYPLSINIRASPLDAGHIVRSLTSKLMAHSHRWESLDFDISQWSPNPFTDVDSQSLFTLKHVRFSAFNYPFDSEDKLDFHGFLAAPNLQTLQIRVSRLSRTVTTMPVNWAGLTHLSLDGGHLYRQDTSPDREQLTAPDMLSILQKCHNLRILSLLLDSSRNQLSEPKFEVTLPNLRALSLTGCMLQIHHLLQSIKTPCLREIHYQPLSGPFSPFSLPVPGLFPLPEVSPFKPGFPLTSFLGQCGHQIEVLSINFSPIVKEDFASWLERIPALKQLTLGFEFQLASPPPLIGMQTEESTFDNSCIDLLTPKQNQPHLCPNLKIFRCSIKSRISGETILAFLNARINPSLVGSSIIEEVSIHQLPYDAPFAESEDGDDDQLRAIREAGVRLSLKKTFYYQCNPVPTVVNGPPGTVLSYGPGYGTDFRFF